MKSSLETTHEITKRIKLSPRRDAIFKELQADNTLSSGSSGVSIKLLCPTGWTIRADSLHSILENYTALFSTWEEAIDAAKDREQGKNTWGVGVITNEYL